MRLKALYKVLVLSIFLLLDLKEGFWFCANNDYSMSDIWVHSVNTWENFLVINRVDRVGTGVLGMQVWLQMYP